MKFTFRRTFSGSLACAVFAVVLSSGFVAADDVAMENVIVHYEKGRFGGWPANHGLWSWDNEIAVGFLLGHFKAKKGHSIDHQKPSQDVIARSLDGGRTWKLEVPQAWNSKAVPKPSPGGIDFSKPGFAMQCRGARFYYSYDRGRTWQGPYQLSKTGRKRIMARTDYLVLGPRKCLVMLTAAKTNEKEGRPFACLTTDGGATFEFRSWIGPEPKGFSIMPSTVRLAGGKLVTAIRRKEGRMGFIDLYESGDEGRSWKHIAKPAKTGQHNGNPPSMILLADGRLCLTYGHRSRLRGIRAKLSTDGGKTWGNEIILRRDGRTWDLGYPRTMQRPDGKIVTIYYFTTKTHPEMHIAATIWKPQPAAK